MEAVLNWQTIYMLASVAQLQLMLTCNQLLYFITNNIYLC